MKASNILNAELQAAGYVSPAQDEFDALQATPKAKGPVTISAAPLQVGKDGLVVQPANAKAIIAKAKLDVRERETQQANDKLGSLGQCMAEAGEAIGTYEVAAEYDRQATIGLVQDYLKSALKLGLTVAHLKAPTKNSPSECWTLLVDSLQFARTVNGFKAISDGTRDNYLSRIRNFVRDNGREPLDLFGNIAAAKAAKAAKLKGKAAPAPTQPVVSQAQSSLPSENNEKPLVSSGPAKPLVSQTLETKNGPVQVMQMKTEGAPSLQMFLAAWIESNESVSSLRDNVAMKMARDLLQQCNVLVGAKK